MINLVLAIKSLKNQQQNSRVENVDAVTLGCFSCLVLKNQHLHAYKNIQAKSFNAQDLSFDRSCKITAAMKMTLNHFQ